MVVTTAIVLAGGLGTRLRSVVSDMPKPMAPINGRPFLEHQFDYWIAQGISRFVLSVGYRHELIMDHFGDSYQGAKLDYVIEASPLGTGGGLLLAAEKVGGNVPFLVLNGDTFFTVDLRVLSAFAEKNDADWCISLYRANEAGRYMGIDVADGGEIDSLKSGTEQIGRLANGGVYWVHPRILADYKSSPDRALSLEDDLFPEFMDAGRRLFGVEFLGTFIDIGVPDDFHRAQTMLGQ